MSVDPRWKELRGAVREEHALPEEIRGQVWDRLQGSIAAGETGPRLESPVAAGASTTTVVAWVVATAAAAVAVTLGVRRLVGGEVREEAVEAVHQVDMPDRSQRATTRVEPDRRTESTAEAPARVTPTTAEPRPEEPPARPRTQPRQIPKPASASAKDLLRAELQLLDRARRELERDDGDRALRVLARHEQEFPAGQLREERAALRIRALCRVGKDAQARGELHRFRREHPGSQHLGKIEEDCGAP